MYMYIFIYSNTWRWRKSLFAQCGMVISGKLDPKKIAGWLISWKIPMEKTDDNWCYPHDLGNLHLASSC